MRTTVRLDDNLLAEAKAYAVRTGRSLTHLIEEALRLTLARRAETPRRRPVRLTVVKGRGLRPGVDLDDTDSLMDLMGGTRHPAP